MARKAVCKPVILEPCDYTVQHLPEGTVLNYTDAAHAKFTAAGWDVLGNKAKRLIEVLGGGRLKIMPR